MKKNKTGWILIGLLLIAAVLFFTVSSESSYPGYRIEKKPLVQMVVSTGKVTSLVRIMASSEMTGTIAKRLAKEGDQVKRGDVLYRLKDDDLEAEVRRAQATIDELQTYRLPNARLEVENAESKLKEAQRKLTRQKQLQKKSYVPKESTEDFELSVTLARNNLKAARLQLKSLLPGGAEARLANEQLALAKAQREKKFIRSPVHGKVLTREADIGDVVTPGKVLMTLAENNRIEVLTPIDERNLSLLKEGQKAQIIADAFSDQPFSATVYFIAPNVDPQRGTVDVRLKIENIPAFIRQDMTVSVNIITARRNNTLLVPNNALRRIKSGKAELVVVKQGKAERLRVQTGIRGISATEVLSGLKEGDLVLADPDSPIKKGRHIKILEQPVITADSDANSDNANNDNNNDGTPGAVRNEPPIRF